MEGSTFHLALEGTGTSSFIDQGGHVGLTEVTELALDQGQSAAEREAEPRSYLWVQCLSVSL